MMGGVWVVVLTVALVVVELAFFFACLVRNWIAIALTLGVLRMAIQIAPMRNFSPVHCCNLLRISKIFFCMASSFSSSPGRILVTRPTSMGRISTLMRKFSSMIWRNSGLICTEQF